MRGKKPTREQRKFLGKAGYADPVWEVLKDTSTEMLIRNKESGDTVEIAKSATR